MSTGSIRPNQHTAFSMLGKCCARFNKIFCIWTNEAIAVPCLQNEKFRINNELDDFMSNHNIRFNLRKNITNLNYINNNETMKIVKCFSCSHMYSHWTSHAEKIEQSITAL